MKKLTGALFLIAFGFLLLSGAIVWADDEKPAEVKKEEAKSEEKAEAVDIGKLKGKDLYKNLCKTCHMEDSKFEEYTPMSLIEEQWETFFDEDFVETHKEVADKDYFGGKPVPEVITEDLIKKLRKFCIDHAADSEHPMTCS